MLSRIFKGTGPGVILLITVTLVLLWISAFIEPVSQIGAVYDTSPMPLYSVMTHIIGTHARTGIFIIFLTLMFVLFMLVNFNTSVFFLGERSFLPAVFYVLLSAVLPSFQVLNPVLPAVIFLILTLERIMESYRKPGTAFNFFDAGLLISTGSLFYANLIWFGLLVFIGIILLRSGNMVEIFSSVVGLLTPYIMVLGIYYVLGEDIGQLISDINKNLFSGSAEVTFSRIQIVLLVFLALVIFVSTIFLLQRIHTMKIKSRKTFYLLFWVLIISVILYMVIPSVSLELIWITAIPVSYIFSHYFIYVRKKLIPEIIFTVFFLLVLLIQILVYF